MISLMTLYAYSKKVNMVRILLSACLVLSLSLSQAQELLVNVKVVAPNLTTTDPVIFQNLEVAIREFYNNTRWTSDAFEPEEKINANVQLTILEELGNNAFSGEIIVQANRPVYNSSYNTPMISLIDNRVSFSYLDRQPIEKSDNRFTDNLSSILTYYAYIILGFDYDSFSENGGEAYFRQAENTLNSVPTSFQGEGWSNAGNNVRNRFTLLENLFNPRMRDFRSAFYDYHIKSLDAMSDDSDKARAIMLACMNSIRGVNTSYPNSMLLNLFIDTKRDEILEIFKVADRVQKTQVYTTLTRIDPSNASKYGILR